MAYRVELPPSVAKAFKRIPIEDARRILEKIKSLEDDPRPPWSEQLQARGVHRRVRAGDYRVIYQVKDDVLVVEVLKIGNRRDVYRID